MSTYTETRRIHGSGRTDGHQDVRHPRRWRGRRRVPTLVAFEWAAVLVVAAALVATLLWLAGTAVPANVPTRPVRVEAGDSLWSIASVHPVEGLTTEQTVEFIRQTNAIDGSALHAGQLLHVPDAGPGSPAIARR